MATTTGHAASTSASWGGATYTHVSQQWLPKRGAQLSSTTRSKHERACRASLLRHGSSATGERPDADIIYAFRRRAISGQG